MRGGKRVGAGRPRKPLIEHVVMGTYRRARHGPVVGNLALTTAPISKQSEWMPAPADLQVLGAAGRRFVAETLTAFETSFVDGQRLLQAARAIDVAEGYRKIDRTGLSQRDTLGLDRAELGWRTLFARLLSELGVPA